MSPTDDYLLRLTSWGLASAVSVGLPIWLSWRAPTRGGDAAEVAYRRASLHFLALALAPILMILVVHGAFASGGAVIRRDPAALPHFPSMESLTRAPLIGWATMIYLAGVLVSVAMLLKDIAALRAFRIEVAEPRMRNEVRRLRSTLGLKTRIAVYVADVDSPQVVGIRTVRLVLPHRFAEIPADERTAILLHEFAHVARYDVARNIAQRGLLCLLWFQPTARWLHRELALAREELCDQWAVSRGASPLALARGLTRLAERGRGNFAVGMAASSHLGHRVRRLVGERQPYAASPWQRIPRFTGPAALSIVAVALTLCARRDGVLEDLYVSSALGPIVEIRARDPAGEFALAVHRGQVLTAVVDGHPLARSEIKQQAEWVELRTRTTSRLLLRVTPYGRIEWQARQAPGQRS